MFALWFHCLRCKLSSRNHHYMMFQVNATGWTLVYKLAATERLSRMSRFRISCFVGCTRYSQLCSVRYSRRSMVRRSHVPHICHSLYTPSFRNHSLRSSWLNLQAVVPCRHCRYSEGLGRSKLSLNKFDWVEIHGICCQYNFRIRNQMCPDSTLRCRRECTGRYQYKYSYTRYNLWNVRYKTAQ